MQPRRAYWAGQTLGWSAVGASQIGLLVAVERFEWIMAAGYVTAAAAGLAGTHALRGLARRRGWTEQAPRAMAMRFGAGCMVVGGFIVVAAFALETALTGVGPGRYGAARLALIYFYWCAVSAGWVLFYLSILFFRRSRLAEIERWKLRAVVKDSELQSLKAQLDPHFLFNSLNSIRALISEDPARAQEMVTRLSALLRYSLRSADAATVPLDEELRAVRGYLDLESIRLEERLRYGVDAAPGSGSAQVPHMLIQTLVENGIKHGVAGLPAGGCVQVSAWVVDGRVRIEVRSTGSSELRLSNPTPCGPSTATADAASGW